ncbi:lmo0937 family membrane protein [Geomonas terrae]|uniref:Lmo0937 family membrane protein n=1 Tax=Geomonas terrae TaxID=2562681 RepID=A0A4S1CKI2_9BACT|nr:lmo0937 family membrane protein [Geomonas terrae]TGU74189.1 lmo0937 family membrane protein [Geomonas terrae]
MLKAIIVVLLVVWLIGLVTHYTFGGYLHLLLGIAGILVILNLIQKKRPL